MEFIDQLNRIIQLSKTPERIVSLVPSQTELLVDLGLKTNLVGVTKFCVHPPNLRDEVAIVGGTKSVKFEKIKNLRPDIIICNKEENTQGMVRQLEEIAPVWISDVDTIDGSIDLIKQMGEVFFIKEKASDLILNIEKEWNQFKEFTKAKKLKKVVYLIWKNPYMAAGNTTFINSLLLENKFENVVLAKASRYPEVNTNDFEKADLILLSTEPFPFTALDVKELQQEFKTEVRLVDGEYFSWYGSRLSKAFNYFKTLH